ncbi:hypothetical protein CGZ98_03550 [Enemella evansiae]|uniref:TetR/AcrR family transcriptional regulator n=1 Tax=Enemella evansiae TaxID=2016499 RepID=UPI000B96F437|nr:TetR/AcrR family transcriptional regulator [Enemella evansiae]OYO15495.1 hypothetical protein CGZ98_03550 [Enemella evansiae]
MTPPGKRELNKQRTRAAIIVAAVDLIARQGYAHTSTTDIARAAGVAPSTLFSHFPTKASILFADQRLWTPPAGIPAAATPAETLVALLEGMLDQPQWVRGIHDPLTAQRFRIIHDNPELTQQQALNALTQAPAFADSLRKLHPDLDNRHALAMAGAMIGAVITVLSEATPTDLRTTVINAARQGLGLPT